MKSRIVCRQRPFGFEAFVAEATDERLHRDPRVLRGHMSPQRIHTIQASLADFTN